MFCNLGFCENTLAVLKRNEIFFKRIAFVIMESSGGGREFLFSKEYFLGIAINHKPGTTRRNLLFHYLDHRKAGRRKAKYKQNRLVNTFDIPGGNGWA